MRFLSTTIALAAFALGCSAPVSSDEQMSGEAPKLRYQQYEVLFTNPTCAEYRYDEPVASVGGEWLDAKPRDAFCTKADSDASGARPDSPQHRLVEWIDDPATTEIFFTAMSFSNGVLQNAMCRAVEERSVKIRFVLDENTSLNKANALLACQPASGAAADAPEMFLRGHRGNISLQHNKMFIANPNADTMRIAFGSGNMSSGVVLHHENWHFVTLGAQTHFAQMHRCAINALLYHATSKGEFSGYMRDCRSAIPAREEGDAKVMFVPGEGGRATQFIFDHIEKADAIDIAAHRYTHSTHVKRIKQRLDGGAPPLVRMVADDDMYWAGQGEVVGGNEPFEYDHVTSLASSGMAVRYVETNHAAHLLHHNKFYLFTMPSGRDAVFSGAGNFTKTAFRDNVENFYLVTIPHVVERYRQQHDHLFERLATLPDDMPADNVLPL